MDIRWLPLVSGIIAVGMATAAATSILVDVNRRESPHQVSVTGVASDGPLPTSTPLPPTPTPTPPPPYPDSIAHCYQPRAEDQAGFVLSPAGERSVFQNCQAIGFYGFPGVPSLGILAQSEPAAMFESLRAQANAYDQVNGPRGVVLVFHMIGAVAQADPGPNGDYLYRMPDSTIREWIGYAEEQGAIVILDIQMGTSTVDEELAYFLPYLQSSVVHLAVDPEWAMPDGVAPGTIIGGMDASAINRAQELMSNYITEQKLYDRMLIVHQFVPYMIRDKELLTTYPGVNLVIDTDGFGYAAAKIGNYNRYIRDEGAPFGGMKLFYRRDIDLMSPADVSALVPQPDFVTYE